MASVKPRVTNSACSNVLIKLKEAYFGGRQLILNSKNLVKFFLDPWMDELHLCTTYPLLFRISLA
jgi:hypothetical protein